METAFTRTATAPYPVWSVGVQLAMPLGENKLSKADWVAAQVRHKDALLAIQALEVAIANDVETSVGLLQSSVERWKLGGELVQREQQQLALERQRLTAGRSDLREVLMREERVLNARFALTEQQRAGAKPEVLVQARQGKFRDRRR